MVQSPSWEANWSAASQEIPRISRNPKVHYRTHKRPPPVSILAQPNPIHIPTSHLLKIHPNIIHTSTPRSPQWSPSLQFPQQDPIHPPLLTHTRHMPSPTHSSFSLVIIIIIIIVITVLLIAFMQCICNYAPETNHASRLYNVAAVLYLQFVLHVTLFRQGVFCTSTSALPAVCVQCPNKAVVCSSLISCFVLLRYCLNDFEMVSVAPVISGITFAFTFHMHDYIYIYI